MKKINFLPKLYVVISLLFANSAVAGQMVPIPEPSILSLFAVVGVVLYILKRRSK